MPREVNKGHAASSFGNGQPHLSSADAECSVTVHLQCRILFCKLTSNKTKVTPSEFKIVLFKGIFWTFANGVNSDQKAESDQGHHCLHPN